MADDDVAALLGCDLSGTKRAICTQLEQRLLRDGGAAQPPSAWSLRVAASEVTGAGEGVHLRGSCEAGTVLACYPGVIFLPDDLPVMHQLVLTGAHGFYANPVVHTARHLLRAARHTRSWSAQAMGTCSRGATACSSTAAQTVPSAQSSP